MFFDFLDFIFMEARGQHSDGDRCCINLHCLGVAFEVCMVQPVIPPSAGEPERAGVMEPFPFLCPPMPLHGMDPGFLPVSLFWRAFLGSCGGGGIGQGSNETPIAGTVTRAWLRRAQLQVDHQGKQNPHSEQPHKTPDQQGVPQHLHTGWQALGVAAGTVVAAVLGVVSRMGRNTQGFQGFLWGMSDTTWNGCRVQVLDTTKEGLLVHVVEGSPSQWDEQAGRMLVVPQGAFGGLGLEGTEPAHTEQTLPRPRPEQSREDSEDTKNTGATPGGTRASTANKEEGHSEAGEATRTAGTGNQNGGDGRACAWEAATIKGMAWPASPVTTGCQGNPCSTGIRWGVSPTAQMGCLHNRSGSPSGADQL